MGDFEELLSRVPPAQRGQMRQWWATVPEAGRAFALKDLTRRLDSLYPQAPADATAVRPAAPPQRPNFPMMAAPSDTLRQQGTGPMVPINRLEQPNALESGLLGFGSAVPFADEAGAALAVKAAPGGNAARIFGADTPEYTTAHNALEYQQGRAQREHPAAFRIGQTVSTVGQILALPQLAASRLAAMGPGRVLAANAGEGMLYGGLQGAGASDEGLENRLAGGGGGAGIGGLFGFGGGVLGELVGMRAGTPMGRRFRNIAEEGDQPLSEARRIVDAAPPGSPVTGADALGPSGAGRLRAVATTPNAGQVPTRSFFAQRQANRPTRVEDDFAEAAGMVGVENPFTRARLLLRARQEEARKGYDAVLRPKGRDYVIPPDRSTPLLQIEEIRKIVNEFRLARASSMPDGPARDAAIRAVQTRAPGMNRVTAEELHHVKRILRERGASAAPGGQAMEQAEGFAANTNLEAVEAVLDRVPGYRTVNDRYAQLSRGMEVDEIGARALQTNPKKLEDQLLQMTPAERQRAFARLPSSVSEAVEQGSARGVLARLGLGQTPKVGKSRILDLFTRERPGFEQRLDEMVGREEGFAQTESAALTAMQNSHTEANRVGNVEAAVSQGVWPWLRRQAFRAFRDAPNAGELAKDAEVLRATGAELREIVSGAEQANVRRGMARKGFNLAGRAVASVAPAVQRTAEMATRSAEQDRFWALRAQGLSEEEALAKVKAERE